MNVFIKHILALVILAPFLAAAAAPAAAPPVPADPFKEAQDLFGRFTEQRQKIEKEREQQLAKLSAQMSQDLLRLHGQCLQKGQVAQAERIMSQMVMVWVRPEDILNDPGNVTGQAKDVGRQLIYRVTGALGGSVWGSDEYTVDSSLSASAVHAGAVRVGETALVLVVITPGRQTYNGTIRNQVTTQDYRDYHASFQVLRIGPLPQPDLPPKPPPGKQ